MNGINGTIQDGVAYSRDCFALFRTGSLSPIIIATKASNDEKGERENDHGEKRNALGGGTGRVDRLHDSIENTTRRRYHFKVLPSTDTSRRH